MKNARAHVVVSGLVQGVFFRSYAMGEAQNLGLKGWVMNRWDGNVEAVFEGEKKAVDEMIGWCQSGPPSAHVGKVDVSWEDYKGEFDSFFVKY